MDDRYIEETVENLEAYIDRLKERVQTAATLARSVTFRTKGELADTVADIRRVSGKISDIGREWEHKVWELELKRSR